MREEIRIGLRQWKRPGKHKTKITALEERTGKPFIEILRSLYWDEQMSCRQIAEYLSKITADLPGRPFEIDKSYVSRRLKMYDIPRRDISEATKLAMRGLKLPY